MVTFSTFRENVSSGVAADAAAGTMSVAVSKNTLESNHVGVSLSVSGGATVTFEFTDNDFNLNRMIGINVFVAASHNASIAGTIAGNVIGTMLVTGSGSRTGHGIRVSNEGGGTTAVLINDNTVQEVGDGAGSGFEGILVVGGVDAGSLHATILNNRISRISDGVGLHVRTTADVVCADIAENVFEDVGGSVDLRLSQSGAGLVNVNQLDLSDANFGATVSLIGSVNLGGARCELP